MMRLIIMHSLPVLLVSLPIFLLSPSISIDQRGPGFIVESLVAVKPKSKRKIHILKYHNQPVFLCEKHKEAIFLAVT